ncbi:MAG: WG repeat-containing protein [Clostridia bacterium]|nr:WG repeat-containing protein [Clostridia bacterium]
MNNYGEKVLDVKFESISRVLKYDDSSAYLIVMNNGKKGIYKNNKEIIEQKYQNINYTESSNIFVVKRNSKYGIFNMDGKEILSVKYIAYALAGDYIYVETDSGEKELYDVNGNKVSNLNYKSVQSSGKSDCYIAIDDNGYYSIITKSETISNNYTYISYAFDNYFIFKNEDGLYGLLDIYNGIKFEAEYSFMLKIDGRNSIEAVKPDGTVDIYSKDLEKIAILKEAIIKSVSENYTMIYSSIDNEIFYINKEGKKVPNTEVYPNNKIFAYSDENGKWGYKDKSGNIVLEAKYDLATDTGEYGFSGIVLDGEWGIVNSEGEIVKIPAFTLDTYYLPTFIGEYLLEITESYHCLELE